MKENKSMNFDLCQVLGYTKFLYMIRQKKIILYQNFSNYLDVIQLSCLSKFCFKGILKFEFGIICCTSCNFQIMFVLLITYI